MSDEDLGHGAADERASRSLASGSRYKILGELSAQTGAGVRGRNTASSGTPIGVQGLVETRSGYGLSTPDDLRVGGTAELSRVALGSEDLRVTGDTSDSPSDATNLVVGYPANEATSGVVGAVIGGGGGEKDGGAGLGGGGTYQGPHTATDDHVTISGGMDNKAGRNLGLTDPSAAPYATVGGGAGNTAFGEGSTVAGGTDNTARESWGTVGGGQGHYTWSEYATVGGGKGNSAGTRGDTVAGGEENAAGTTSSSTAFYATVGGGHVNEATGQYTTISGGKQNRAKGVGATVGGGASNQAGASGQSTAAYGTVPGGRRNVATGVDAFAAGRRGKATDDGAFVWADRATDGSGSVTAFRSDAGTGPTGPNTFHVRSVGGARFVSGVDSSGSPTTGVKLASGGGGWNQLSSRAVKEAVEPVDPPAVLEQLRDLEVSTWAYETQDGVRHIGPMAEAFHEAFDVGEDPATINGVDADGVALAAIQGLATELDETRAKLAAKADRVAALETRLDRKDDRIDALESRLATIEAQLGNGATADD